MWGGSSSAASALRWPCTMAAALSGSFMACKASYRLASKAQAMSEPNMAIASSAAMRETALFTPDAVPAASGPTAFMTVVVSGATVTVMPMPSTTMAGKNVLQ